MLQDWNARKDFSLASMNRRAMLTAAGAAVCFVVAGESAAQTRCARIVQAPAEVVQAIITPAPAVVTPDVLRSRVQPLTAALSGAGGDGVRFPRWTHHPVHLSLVTFEWKTWSPLTGSAQLTNRATYNCPGNYQPCGYPQTPWGQPVDAVSVVGIAYCNVFTSCGLEDECRHWDGNTGCTLIGGPGSGLCFCCGNGCNYRHEVRLDGPAGSWVYDRLANYHVLFLAPGGRAVQLFEPPYPEPRYVAFRGSFSGAVDRPVGSESANWIFGATRAAGDPIVINWQGGEPGFRAATYGPAPSGTTMTVLSPLAGTTTSFAYLAHRTTHPGPFPVGSEVTYGGSDNTPTRWVNGVGQAVPSLEGFTAWYASGDANFLLGSTSTDGTGTVMVWTPGSGAVPLTQVLANDYGIDTSQMTFTLPLGMAPVGEVGGVGGGQVIADEVFVLGTLAGQPAAWWIRLWRIPIGVEGTENRWMNPASGNWSSGSNWVSGTAPNGATAIPVFDQTGTYTVTVDQSLDLAGLVTVGSLSRPTLVLNHPMSLHAVQTPGCDGYSMRVAGTQDSSSTLTVRGGTLAIETEAWIGAGIDSSGTLTVGEGGIIDNDSSGGGSSREVISVGYGAGSMGTLQVAQGGEVQGTGLTLAPGAGSSATMTILGQSQSGIHSRGQFLLTKVGDKGSATVTIGSGATLTTDQFSLGVLPGSSGTIAITAPDQHLSIDNTATLPVEIGVQGTGSLTLSGGGTINFTNPADGPGTEYIGVGTSDGGTGTLTVHGPSVLIGDNMVLTVASGSNANGSLTVDGGGIVRASLIELFRGGGNASQVSVLGTGSLVEAREDLGGGLVAAALNIGRGGDGNVSVGSGGTLASLFDCTIGTSAPNVVISGTGSRFTVARELRVDGYSDSIPRQATLLVNDGGLMTTGSCELGEAHITIDGAATRWNNAGHLRLRGSNSSSRGTTLRVLNGAKVRTQTFDAGRPNNVVDATQITVGSGSFDEPEGIHTDQIFADDVATIAAIPNLVFLSDAGFGGAGTWPGSFTNYSVVSPGGGADSSRAFHPITISGSYTQSPQARLEVQLATSQNIQSDRLIVNGAAFLAGTLRITGYSTPDALGQMLPGSTAIVLTSPDIVGEFESFEYPPLPPGLGLDLVYDHDNAQVLIVVVSVPICTADYNQDGGIDGADVSAFFGDWEAGNAAADFNQDGGVDGADVGAFFERWEAGC